MTDLTVTVTHPERGEHQVTLEVAAALVAQNEGWRRNDEAVAADNVDMRAEIGRLNALLDTVFDDMGELNVDDIKAIEDPARVALVLEGEQRRARPRKGAVDHLTQVLTDTNTKSEED